MRALRPGAMIVFISVWPVLKSLPQIGTPRSRASSLQRRDVDGQVGRAVRVRHALHERRIGVDHRRRDRRIVRLHRLLERLDRRVRRRRLACTPRSSRTRPSPAGRSRCSCLKRGCPRGAARPGRAWSCPFLTFVAVQPLDVALVEDRRHRLDRRAGSPRPARGARLAARPPCSRPRTRRPGSGPSAPKTRSSSFASGTNSLISGDRLSVRLPSRIVAHLRQRADRLRQPARTPRHRR